MALKKLLAEDRSFFIRVLISVVLYLLFIATSLWSFYSETVHEMPLVVGAFLIVSVLILPRSARRPTKPSPEADPKTKEEAEFWRRVENQLTILRLVYMVVAALVWFGLPKLLLPA